MKNRKVRKVKVSREERKASAVAGRRMAALCRRIADLVGSR